MARRTIIQRRRWMHIVWLCAVVLLLGGFVLGAFNLPPGANVLFNLLSGLAAIGIVVVMVVRELMAGRRLAALVKSDWSRCLYCFFDLRGLTHKGECPECGERYEIERVRRSWRRALRPEAMGKAERMVEAD